MKKILCLFCFITASLNIYSQKSYVNIISMFGGYHMTSSSYLSGDIPPGIEKEYRDSSISIGEILTKLSEKGFEVESMCGVAGNSYVVNYLLSKKTSNDNSFVRSVKVNDEDIIEVARYNLQGIPVKENEKGIQIIVFSNYTTKTIIVQ